MHQTPRPLNPEETFERLVSWLANKISTENIPGIIVGVSGTDSLLSFLVCYHAYKRLGHPHRALAINFVHPEGSKDNRAIKCEDGNKNWFAAEVMPWLKNIAPDGSYEINDSIPHSDDAQRWGNLFSRALQDVAAHQDLGGKFFYVAGTRNRTEKILGTYTLISKNPSLQPIEHLYKTEVLQICQYLGIPQIAMDKSREIDCACGRFQVQAHYMDELDAFIMVEKEELCASYLENIAPDTLTAVREFYIEETTRNKFREQIPYRAPEDMLSIQGYDLRAAFDSLEGQDVSPITRAMPSIMEDANAKAAFSLLAFPAPNRQAWRAEAYTLLGVAGLSEADKNAALQNIFNTNPISPTLADLSARIGQYSFSFPAKRFIATRFNDGPSLLERAGFTRLCRDNDVRDASLPRSNPERDEFGTGFIWHDDNWYIEQRRAYMLVARLDAHHPVALLIRNSSPYFGRTRLAEPAYLTTKPQTAEKLKNLSRSQIEAEFMPWQEAAKLDSEALEQINIALNFADQIDLKFSQWLCSRDTPRFKTENPSIKEIFNANGGAKSLHGFIKQAFAAHIENDRMGSPLYLCRVPKGAAPWRPKTVAAVDANLLADLKIYCEGGVIKHPDLKAIFRDRPLIPDRQLVLLTNPQGDYPLPMMR